MTCDLAVVGGGIVGATAAYLTRTHRPEWRVVLLERSLVGAGATLHSVGLDIPYGSTPRRRELVRESAALFREIGASVPGLPFHPVPLFGIAGREQAEAVREGYPLDGVRPATAEEEARLRGTFEDLLLPQESVLLGGCRASYSFPAEVAARLAARFRERGGECREGTEVAAIEPAGDGYTLAASDGRTLRARRVLVATGPWVTRGPGAEAAREAGVRIKKVVALHLDRPARRGDPVLFFHDEDAFLLPVPERGEWLFSFTCREWDVEPDAGRLSIRPADREQALGVLERYLPSWVPCCTGGRVFCDAYAPDWNPVVREPHPALVVAGACAGSGYRLAPGIAMEALRRLGIDRRKRGSPTGDPMREHAPAGRPAIITAAQPTPNGDLHLGHLSGPYLGADVHARYLRLRGREVRYLCGSDDHQSYVTLKAEQTGSTPARVATRYASAIASTLEAAEIRMDLFVRHSESPRHRSRVRDFFATLYANGALEEREAPSLYCETCERYLFEAFVKGGCPHCGTPTGGNACEVCGRPNDCVELESPECRRCGRPASVRTFRRLYFPVGRWTEELREHLSRSRMSPRLRALAERMIEDGLPDVSVSHLADWGIPVPVPGYEEQRIYTWLEMLAGYLSAAQESFGRDVWQGDAEVVQFFGIDNGWYHALLYPALLLAHGGYRPPETFVSNEFYRLDGLKFSTSRMHAIWGREMLAVVPADAVRFYLACSGPEAEQTNFTVADFEATVHRELVEGWQGWLHGLGARVAEECGGEVPGEGPLTPEHHRFLARLARLRERMEEAYEAATFSPRSAARTLSDLVQASRSFGSTESAWAGVRGRRAERRAGLALELTAARALATLAWPLLPVFAGRLLEALRIPLAPGAWDEALSPVPAGAVPGLDAEHFPDVRRRFTTPVRVRSAARTKAGTPGDAAPASWEL
ncbi:MAG TPA: FAD-dependent oxidoreductase [Longimicrobiaceae bacterium]|nr:FAD-dependent oxidoreductase [Longimicrobiaceae bacterium]